MVKLSLIIPVYNEEKRIGETLEAMIKYLDENKYIYEIIIVDDDSPDKTLEIIKENANDHVRILTSESRIGKGYSVKRGILEAKYPLVLFMDADLATPIEEIEGFLKHIEKGYDIVIASRNMKGSNIVIRQPFHRRLLGSIFPIMVRLITVRGIKDTQCGFKLFKKEVAREIVRYQTIDKFAFDVELLFIAKKFGHNIKESPVTWIDKEGSKVSSVKDSGKMLIDLLRIRYNNIKGKYKVT